MLDSYQSTDFCDLKAAICEQGSIRIRDSIHGSIALSAYEKAIIDHPYMQRLRYIRQLGFFHLVFPGATHSRFEHSIGVLHMATCAYLKIRENQFRLFASDVSSLEELERFEAKDPKPPATLAPTQALVTSLFSSPYALATLRAAALLHDIGHSPYSHCSEKFLPSVEEVLASNADLPDYLKSAMRHHPAPASHNSSSASHEIFTLLLAWKVLEDISHFSSSESVPQSRDILALLSPAISLSADSPLASLEGYEVLSELLSGEVDADRMDYLPRDSKQAGVSYGSFDVSRLLDSLHVVYLRESRSFGLAYGEGGLYALEDYLKARRSMFKQLYFHKTSVACEAMLQHISKHFAGSCFPASHQEYGKLCDHHLQQVIATKIRTHPSFTEECCLYLSELNEGLFSARKLWKRWQEFSSSTLPKASLTEKSVSTLRKKGIRHEVVLSVNFLTTSQKKTPLFPLIIKPVGKPPMVKSLIHHHPGMLEDKPLYVARIYTEPFG